MLEQMLNDRQNKTNLDISNAGEVSWFLQVVESFVLHQLSYDLVSDLISPLVDHWHVDVINEHSHLLSSRWAIGATHSFVHVTFYCSLKEQKISL